MELKLESNFRQSESELADHLAMPVIFSTPNRPAFPSDWSMQQIAQWDYLGRGPVSSNLAEAGGFFDLPLLNGSSTLGDSHTVDATNRQTHSIQLHVTPTHYLRYPGAGAPSAMTIAVTGSQPGSRGTVRLRSADPFEPPEIDPGYLTDPDDIQALIAGVELARKIAATDPLASLIGKELLPGKRRSTPGAVEKSIRRYAMTLYHPVGTCPMGTDPDTSVVDPNLRVHGVDGLLIADASVFPTIPKANPAAMVMMVANRVLGFVPKGV